jgi:cell wall-associated NlpC family hydrolase
MQIFLSYMMLLLLSCTQLQPAGATDGNVGFRDFIDSPGRGPAGNLPFNAGSPIETGTLTADSLLQFAYSLTGTPYRYASADPATGFDCSGFITYVFNHFNIAVPRSSADFDNQGRQVALSAAKPGDLILFTGTDSLNRTIGHMGIVTDNANDSLYFIHATSGRANSVTITLFSNYYRGRFVKINRILRQ